MAHGNVTIPGSPCEEQVVCGHPGPSSLPHLPPPTFKSSAWAPLRGACNVRHERHVCVERPADRLCAAPMASVYGQGLLMHFGSCAIAAVAVALHRRTRRAPHRRTSATREAPATPGDVSHGNCAKHSQRLPLHLSRPSVEHRRWEDAEHLLILM